MPERREQTVKDNRARLKRLLKAMLNGGGNFPLLAPDGPRPSYRRIIE